MRTSFRRHPPARCDVDGVFALGSTRAEVEARMGEALAAHVRLLRERGQPVPEPRTEAGRVAA